MRTSEVGNSRSRAMIWTFAPMASIKRTGTEVFEDILFFNGILKLRLWKLDKLTNTLQLLAPARRKRVGHSQSL